jgi:hypothetical protein
MPLIFELSSSFWFDPAKKQIRLIQRVTLPNGKVAGIEAEIRTDMIVGLDKAKTVAAEVVSAQQKMILEILKQEGLIF